MPQITGSLFEGKPIVSVAVAEALPVAPPVAPQQEAPGFHIKEYRALLDTGADITCVLPHVVKECFLVSRGLVAMTSGSGTYDHMSYLIRLGIWCEEVAEVDGEQLVDKLAEIGVKETEPNIRNKLARGKFTAVFLLQCLEAVGASSLRLSDS